MALHKYQDSCTIEAIYNLPDGERAELIDGQLYYMAPPSRTHQRIVTETATIINQYIKQHSGSCEVNVAPFAVFLDEDDATYVEPDITVICDPSRLSEQGCMGAPDWIIEVVSKSSIEMDYFIKLIKYRNAGVRSYWIVDPSRRTTRVYNFSKDDETADYSFDVPVPVYLYPDLCIRLSDFI